VFIGELAKATKVPAPTIRYYEALGLLKPVKRTRGGFRVYDDRAIPMLRFIRHAQNLGFSLKEIGQILKAWQRTGNPCPTAQSVVLRKLDQLDKWLESLTTLKERLERLLRALEVSGGGDGENICPCLMATEPVGKVLPHLATEGRKRHKRRTLRRQPQRLDEWSGY